MAHHICTNIISSPPLALTKPHDESGHVISVWQLTIYLNMENLEEDNREENASQSSEMDEEQLQEEFCKEIITNNMNLLGIILFLEPFIDN